MGSATWQIFGLLQSNGRGVGRIHMSRCVLYPEGSRSGLLAKFFLGGLGYQGQKTTIVQEHTGLLALWQGQKNSMFLDNCGFLALVPQASKKPLGQ